MAEGDRELNERILLAEKEKKIDVERVKTKNELKFQGYLNIYWIWYCSFHFSNCHLYLFCI